MRLAKATAAVLRRSLFVGIAQAKLISSTRLLAIGSRRRNPTATHACVPKWRDFAKLTYCPPENRSFEQPQGHIVKNIEVPGGRFAGRSGNMLPLKALDSQVAEAS